MGSDNVHGEGEDGVNGEREQCRGVNLVGDGLVILGWNCGVNCGVNSTRG